ncbi:MAG: hypothetical protein CL441_06280 [Acidimicrobiaceae bacterium]|nr:hypothetical protein [Acidimicrobiaceae bacterium]|tara:strand:+ start:169 stop:480 length:312 start_codon:yes stop_codon:yes gene_type:complete
MAIYKVTARFKEDQAAALRLRLDDGSLAAQQPDGEEMVRAFGHAVVTDDGLVMWSEMCFCPTPLAHERATQLDQFFVDLTTTPIEKYEAYEGRPFLEYLDSLT